jgi:hypothetical protein
MYAKRDLAVTRRFFNRVLEHGPRSTEVSTDRASLCQSLAGTLVPV